jgi:ferredoxin-NADP reductase
METTKKRLFQASVTRIHWLNENVFEVGFERPEGFSFIPGQKIQLKIQGIERDYTLINHPDDQELSICVRHVSHGRFTPLLAQVSVGEVVDLSGPTGFFTYQTMNRDAVFVATGTGIAPFLAYIRAGAHDFYFLHGVRDETALLYREEVEQAAKKYIPCLSVSGSDQKQKGRVTEYLEKCLQEAKYDFYLCGNSGMLRDAMRIIDRGYSDSRVFMATFF